MKVSGILLWSTTTIDYYAVLRSIIREIIMLSCQLDQSYDERMKRSRITYSHANNQTITARDCHLIYARIINGSGANTTPRCRRRAVVNARGFPVKAQCQRGLRVCSKHADRENQMKVRSGSAVIFAVALILGAALVAPPAQAN
jgi:hypothetical protein